jgi:glycosyltransferase involved in cell wall biosynthesis
MKLVIATPLYPPEIGGPATYAKLLYEGLPKKGIEVQLVKFSEVRHLPKIIRHYVYYRHVLAAARTADAVLALDPVSVGLPALYATKKSGKQFVVKIVGDYAWEQGRQRFGVTQNLDEFVKTKQTNFFVRILQKVQIRVAASATRVIVPSKYLKNIITAWGIPSGEIEVIYNAVSIDEIGNVPKAVNELLRPLVVTVGRLVPWKHIDRIIDAVWAVRRENKHLSLVVVGDGPDRKKLEDHANHLLKKDFHFTGQLSHPDTLATIKAADIFVLNSSYEGLSHVLIEAKKLGIPAIITDAGGNSEVAIQGGSIAIRLEDEKTGLTSGLSFLASDAKERENLSRSAKQSTEHFNVETMITNTANLLRCL